MRNGVITFIFLVAIALPAVSFAACSKDGYTVVFVNGIFTETKGQADADKDKLALAYSLNTGHFKNITFITGYNESHLGGAADIAQSVAQGLFTSTSDYNLKSILTQIHGDLKTRKVLLVGHSQGSFYTNEIYDYLTSHGVPLKSIAIYNVAMPAHELAGPGDYMTSSNDTVINGVRDWEKRVGIPAAAEANITISIPASEKDVSGKGHYFQEDYLAGAGEQMVQDMDVQLAKLSVPSGAKDDGECFVAPVLDDAYAKQQAMFASVDPAASGVFGALGSAWNGVKTAAVAIGSGYTAVQDGFNSMVAGAWYSVFPKPNAENADKVLAVTKKLYGSSLSDSELSDLLAEGDAEHNPFSNPRPQQEAQPAQQKIDETARTIVPKAPSVLQPAAIAAAPYQPGFGGGGTGVPAATDAPVSHETATSTDATATSTAATTTPAKTATSSPAIPFYIASPADGAVLATTTVAFFGTTTPAFVVTASSSLTLASTTADAQGEWSLTLSVSQGSEAVHLELADATGTIATITRTITIDTAPPGAPQLSVVQCAYSLSSEACLVPVSKLSLVWNDEPHVSQYEVWGSGALIATTSAPHFDIAQAAASSTYEVVTRKMNGLAATSSSIAVIVKAHPIIINEIAWAGSLASAEDEWVEFKNTTDVHADLSHLVLTDANGSFSIPLTGALDMGHRAPEGTGFAVLARAQGTIAKRVIVAQTSADLSLADAGDQLLLQWSDGTATTTIDATPPVSACAGWCAGSGADRISMERTDDEAADGTLASSWHTNDVYESNYTDSAAKPIHGSPFQRNSYGWPEYGFFCGGHTPVADGSTFTQTSSYCTFLTKYLGDGYGVMRDLDAYVGTVGSSTLVTNQINTGYGWKNERSARIFPGGTPAGPAFVVFYKDPASYANQITDLQTYYQTGVTSGGNPTLGTAKVISFLYQP